MGNTQENSDAIQFMHPSYEPYYGGIWDLEL
jgi:ABC-type cobalt transport system substrate-binding protein